VLLAGLLQAWFTAAASARVKARSPPLALIESTAACRAALSRTAWVNAAALCAAVFA
jgi:hypothetical protein